MIRSLNASLSKHSKIIENLFWRSVQVLGKQGISFFIFYLSSQLLTSYDFGIYNYAFSIILLLSMFSDFGISTAVAKFVVEFQEDKRKLRQLVFNASAIVSVIMVIVSILLLAFGKVYFGDKFIFVLYLLPLLLFAPLTSLYDGIYRGLNMFKQSALISILVGIFSVAVSYFSIKQFGLNGAFLSQNIFYLLLLIMLILNYREIEWTFNRKIIIEVGKYSLIIGIGSIGFMLYSRVDVLFLGHYNYIETISYYEIMNKFLSIVLIPFSIVAQVVSPIITNRYMKKDYEGVYSKFKKYFVLALIASSVGTLFLYFSINPILDTFFVKYATPEMKSIASLMILMFFTQMLNGIFPLGFVNATGHAKISTYFLLISGLLHIGLNYVMIINFGSIGIIYSIVISRISTDILFLAYYASVLKKRTLIPHTVLI